MNQAHHQASTALLRAENDLRQAADGDDEPRRVFFFGEASLAHETALTLREMNDLDGAVSEFRRSVTKRKAAFARTHAVTLGYLGATQVKQGSIEAACATWSKSLDAMQGVRSGRTRQVASDMRSLLCPFKQRGLGHVTDIDARAASYLSTWS